MLIDFKEIPPSNKGGAFQDSFEDFCCTLLKRLGYKIISEPGRGADGGLDILAEELRLGIGGESKIRWLVSCKHYAKSNKSISKEIELDILDRVQSHKCDGFLGFYSTTPAQSLINHLTNLKEKIEFQILSKEKIENFLIGIEKNEDLVLRFFPDSYKKWKSLYYFLEPINLYEEYCNRDHSSKTHLDFLKKFFLETGPILKAIRRSETINDLFLTINYKLLIIEEFSRIPTEPKLILNYIIDPIPKKIRDMVSINNGEDFVFMSMDGLFRVKYIVSKKNIILISKEFESEFSEFFEKSKHLLS